LEPGDHGSTFGGNALTCAGAYATVEYVISNDVLSNVVEMGNYLRAGLDKLISRYEFITEIRGTGLLLALQFNSDVTPQVVAMCNEEGLLLNPLRPNAVRLMPPLTVSKGEIDSAIERLNNVLSKVTFA
jgi:acetylornithine/succinyldiaminopimelate/putrescine aminotransferase